MKFGIRKPSIKKRIAARTSPKRFVRHNLGLKAPRGWGWITNPKRAAYNRVYNRTSISVDELLKPRKRRKSKGCCCLQVIAIPTMIFMSVAGILLLFS